MFITFTTQHKAIQTSIQHFDGKYTKEQMYILAKLAYNKRTEIGKSDRANPHYTPATIIWAPFQGTMLQLTVDTPDFQAGNLTIITMYPVTDIDWRRDRFNMVAV